MKKIVYSLVTAVAVVAAMVCCSHKENEVVDKTGYQYRFVIAETDTRATLDDQGVLWEVGDQVGVFLGEQLNSTNAPVNATDDPKTIEVTSTEPVATVYAYYPYNAANEAGATTAEVVFPASQAGGSVSAMPMAGLPTEVNVGGEGSANGVIHFVNLGSVIDFRIYSSGDENYSGETVESVTFRAPGMAVSGTATLDLTQVSYDESTKTVTVPEMTMTGGAGTTYATVTQSVGVTASKTDATTPIYLVVAPGTYTGTIVVNTNAASYTFSYENREFKRNGLRKYNLNLNNATREAVTKTYTNIGTSELSEGVYLLGAYDSSSNGDGVGTYICWVPNTADGANTGSTVISHIKYSSSDISSISSDGLENRSADITGSEVEVIKAGDDWLVKVKKTGKYLYYSETGGIGFTTEAANAGHTWEFGTGSNNSKRRFVYPSNFEFYHSGREKGFLYGSNKGAFNFRFYKLSGSTKSQSIWFEQPEGTVLAPDAVLTYDLASAEPFVAPVLKGVKTTVLYESSNSAIASVDAISGAVTFGGTQRGTVTITATAAGESGYASATASYKIDVSDSSIPVSVYNKVTSVSDLEPGAKYLLVFEGLAGDTDGDGNPKVFSAVLNSNGTEFLKNGSAALDVTIANGVIESSDFDNCQFTLEAGYYLKGDQANKYIYPGSSSGSSVMLAESTASHALTIAFNNGIAEIANGGRYLVWSTSSHYFSCNENVSGQYSTGICLYKLDDGRQSQTLTFNYDEFEYDLATGNWTPGTPALSGAQTSPLTWESSNTAVATVNASGMVAPQGKGSATITVTAPASAQYRGAMASYELTVVNSAEAPSVFTRVNSAAQLVPGAKYLLVYETGNFVFYPYLANGIFAKAIDNKISVTITDHTITSLDLDACLMTLEEGYYLYVDAEQMYIYPASSSGTALNPETTKSHALTISFNNGIASVASGNQYFYYSANSKWFSSTSTPGSVNTSLYMLDDGQPKARNLAFSEPSMSVDIYDKTTPYTLTGTPTLTGLGLSDVTYAISGDSGVASVNASSGVVTLLGSTGTVTVTASAPATDDFQSDSASYTITVTNTPPPTYTRISGAAELVTGTYVITDKQDTYLFNASGSNNGGYSTINSTTGVTRSDLTITLASDVAEAHEFVITRTDNTLTIKQVGGTHAGQFMFATASTASTYIGFQGTAKNFTLNPQENTDLIYFYTDKSSSSPTEYLYKKTSDAFFKLGGSGAPGGGDAGVYLYKKND